MELESSGGLLVLGPPRSGRSAALEAFARQLADPDLVGDILDELAATGTPSTGLVLDVEDQAITASPGAVERLEELAAALGC